MTNSEISKVLIELIGANLNAHKLLGDLVARMPEDQQDALTETLKDALKCNSEALSLLKKGMGHG